MCESLLAVDILIINNQKIKLIKVKTVYKFVFRTGAKLFL